VPSRAKIATSAVFFCLKFGSKCRASAREGRKREVQTIPVYFASEALSGSNLFYSELEKMAYAVVMAARKLRHYFEGHRIRVITNQSINH
jgi:hypothetical protein